MCSTGVSARGVVRADAGIRDADVEPAEALDCLRDRRLDLIEVPHVAGETECVGESEVVPAA